jgi:hypothetical protein
LTVTRRLSLAVAAATMLATVPALAQQHRDPGVSGPVSGTIFMAAQGAAAGIGYTWGDGVLHYGRRSYHFSVNGVTVADVGYSKVTGRGRVYGLKRLQDFSGTYVASTGEATLVNGIGGQILRNANGVQIRVDQVTRGARLQGSADGITLTLK